MKRLIYAIAALLAVGGMAQAATVTLPTVTFTTPGSSSIACTQTAAANLVVPVAAGTVIFSCVVTPPTWAGVVTGTLNAPFAVSGLSGNTFNIIVSSSVTVAGTVSPGSVTTAP